MKNGKIGIFGLGLGALFCGATWAQQVPAAKERKVKIGQDSVILKSRLKSILHANFTFNYHHNAGKPVVQKTLTDLAAAEGWTLTNITDHTKITLDELRKNEVVVFNNISNFAHGNLSDATESAIQTFIEEGGGAFTIHGSGDSQSNQWPWHNQVFHPVGYEGHAAQTNAEIFRGGDANGHPVMEGLFEDGVQIAYGEWYKNTTAIYNNSNAEVLMEFDPSTCGGCVEQRFIHPEGNGISWVLNIGKGRNLFFPFGHEQKEKDDFNDPGQPTNWDKFIRQGLYYVAGYDTTEITTSLTYPHYKEGSLNFHPTQLAVLFNEAGKNSVRLMDIQGKTLDARTVDGPKEFRFDESKLKPGIYFLRATSNGKVQSKRYLLN